MLSMLGGIVGDAEVQRAMSEYTKAWAFKHPSPWDYIFFMNNALKQDLAGSGTTGCGRPSRWTARSPNVTTDGREDDGDGAAGRPDAVAGGARRCSSPADGPGDQADGQREDDRRHDARSSPGRWTSGSTAAARSRRRSTSAAARSRAITLDPGCRFPGSRSERQRVAAGRTRGKLPVEVVPPAALPPT